MEQRDLRSGCIRVTGELLIKVNGNGEDFILVLASSVLPCLNFFFLPPGPLPP